jgi:hypothetical protein
MATSRPLVMSTAIGAGAQLLMVLIGKFVPAIGAMPNFYSICGTVIAAVTGAMVARSSPGASTGSTAIDGAAAGGASSVIGGMLAVATGQWPGFQLVQILFPAISGAIGGSVGGLVTRMMAGSKSAT